MYDFKRILLKPKGKHPKDNILKARRISSFIAPHIAHIRGHFISSKQIPLDSEENKLE